MFDIQNVYKFGKILGSGSFAQVAKITRFSSKKNFAVKIINKKLIKKDWRNLHSILKEIDIMRDCSHPYIVPLYEVYESESNVYLVMKLLEGD